jgi:hypothetical protein
VVKKLCSACQTLAEKNNCDVIVDVLFREWDIYRANKAFLSEEKENFGVDSEANVSGVFIFILVVSQKWRRNESRDNK